MGVTMFSRNHPGFKYFDTEESWHGKPMKIPDWIKGIFTIILLIACVYVVLAGSLSKISGSLEGISFNPKHGLSFLHSQ